MIKILIQLFLKWSDILKNPPVFATGRVGMGNIQNDHVLNRQPGNGVAVVFLQNLCLCGNRATADAGCRNDGNMNLMFSIELIVLKKNRGARLRRGGFPYNLMKSHNL